VRRLDLELLFCDLGNIIITASNVDNQRPSLDGGRKQQTIHPLLYRPLAAGITIRHTLWEQWTVKTARSERYYNTRPPARINCTLEDLIAEHSVWRGQSIQTPAY